MDARPEPIETLAKGIERFKGRLLLLGEAGAGKTVSLMTTARDAVVKRMNDPNAPLPILLRCTEWQSDPPLPLRDWIRRQTQLKLTSFDNTFVLLDGFDELGEQRVKKVEQRGEDGEEEEREEFYDPRPLFLDILPKEGQLLLSCRVKEYEAFGRKVDLLNGAVTLKPLTNAQIQAYLANLPELWHALQRDQALLDALRTPLLLSLFAFGYQDTPDALKALKNAEAEQVSESIFKKYVKKRYAYEVQRLQAMSEQLPFTLDEIYGALGRVAMRNASGDWGVQDNVLTARDFALAEGLALKGERLTAFTAFAAQLHLLVPVEGGTWRFMHLRLRDHFVRAYCLPLVSDPSLYDRLYEDNPALALASLPNAEALDLLVNQLSENTNSSVRAAAARALGQLGWQPQTTEDKVSWCFAKQAWDELVKIGAPAVDPLIAALKDDDWYVRAAAREALDRIQKKA